MLAYAANSRRTAGRSGSPKALVLILAGHAALIAAVMTAKMDDRPVHSGRSDRRLIDIPIAHRLPPPPTRSRRPSRSPITQPSFIDRTDTIVDMDANTPISARRRARPSRISRRSSAPTSSFRIDPPKPAPVRLAARFNTPRKRAEAALSQRQVAAGGGGDAAGSG